MFAPASGQLEIGVFAPGTDAAAATNPYTIAGLPMHPVLQPYLQDELSKNIFVFFIGFLVMFFGLFLAKKFGGLKSIFMSEEDSNLIEKAKRAFGMP